MMKFREFWPRYLRAHRHPANRAAHYCVTLVSFGAIAAGIILNRAWIPVAAIAASYGIAIASHRLFERNHSLVMVNPVWGAVADLKMCWLALTGRLKADLELHVGPTASWHGRASREEIGARMSGC